MPPIEEFAAAKINLTLEVHGRRSDGYHALSSLVAFALDIGDHLVLRPGLSFSLETDGPEAVAIDGPNLVTTTAHALSQVRSGLTTGALQLTKNLPVASGIGGGSADAAAAIRAIARANGIDDPAAEFAATAVAIGADIPVCVGDAGNAPSAAFMTGIGERVWRPAGAPLLPPESLAAVLVNPRVPVPTGAVFKALAAPALSTEPSVQPPAPFTSIADCIAYIADKRNDLEDPAIGVAPAIGDVLAALRALPGYRLARMSGSGATCFALFDSLDEAHTAERALHAAHPGWWMAATRLG